MAIFQKGNSASPGRKGVRNRLSNALLEALAADFEQFGVEAVRITRVERPAEYLKIVAGIMPKELEIIDLRLKEIPDDELMPSLNSPDSDDLLLTTLTAEKTRRHIENRLAYYKPYPKQIEFHSAGMRTARALLMAGNQLGKTLAGGFEAAMHATGRYPDWWKGKRFDRPVIGWACGVTGEVVRDTVQKILVGRTGEQGTGAIPKDAIAELVTAAALPICSTLSRCIMSRAEFFIGLKTYASGREKFQGETLDFVWFDEEPPADIYTEGLTRTNVGANPVWMTFTPLQGVSTVVKRFLHEKSDDRHQGRDDDRRRCALHRRRKKKIIASYPAHELEARTKGIPILGSGRIFPVAEDLSPSSTGTSRPLAPIGGLDFGWTHPIAAVELVQDRDTDTIYVTRTHRCIGSLANHAGRSPRPWGNLRWAWPRDGSRETLEGAGIALAEQYQRKASTCCTSMLSLRTAVSVSRRV